MRAPSSHRLFPGALIALALCSSALATSPAPAQAPPHDHPQPAAPVSPDPEEEQAAEAQEGDRQQEARAENARASTTRRAARPATVPARRSRDRHIISVEEISTRAGATTALDLVRSLRPSWLRSRRAEAAVSPVNNSVVVYQNNVRLGGPEVLSQIPAAVVSGLRFYDGIEAGTRWGPNHGAGVIAITIN